MIRGVKECTLMQSPITCASSFGEKMFFPDNGGGQREYINRT